jgi:hypothetical protein
MLLVELKCRTTKTKIFTNEYEAQVNYLRKHFPISRAKNEQFRIETRKDEGLQIVSRYIKEGWPNSKAKCRLEGHKRIFGVRSEMVIIDNLVYRGNYLVVPETTLRKEILDLNSFESFRSYQVYFKG